jgi:hypothetical protein
MGMDVGKNKFLGNVYGYKDYGCFYLLWVIFCHSLYEYIWSMGIFVFPPIILSCVCFPAIPRQNCMNLLKTNQPFPFFI